MGKRVTGRPDLSSPRGPATIIVVGTRSEDALCLKLRKAFDGARFFPDLATSDIETADLAVGIFEGNDYLRLYAFAERAHTTGVPGLSVALWPYEMLIGPLALAGRAGCARCAFERMAAASEASTQAVDALALDTVAGVTGPVLVREVRAILRRGVERSHLLDHVLAVDAGTLEATLHRVIPLPRCAVCGGAAAFPSVPRKRSKLSPEDAPEVVLRALAGLLDQRTGIISGAFLEPPASADLTFPFVMTAAPPRIKDDDGTLRQLPLGWGKGLTLSGALLSAVGEAVERYAASLPDSARITWKRTDELDGEYLDPLSLPLYTDAQYERAGFPFARFDPGVRHPWVQGKWLGAEGAVWVPAVFAFLSLTLRPEHLICQGTSNGLAASTDPDDAALRATLELVERDAFMTAWLAARPGRRVELDDTLDPLLRRVLNGIQSLGAAVEVYLLPTSACGTTVLCLGLGDGDNYPGATLGLGTDLDPRSALRQAVLELAQTGPFLRRMMQSNALPVADNPASVSEMLQHAAYYFPRERAAAFDRLRNSDAPLALRDMAGARSKRSPKRSLMRCASELKAAGVRVALVDVTSADVATRPFCVMRAVSPDLQPIWYGHGFERPPVERLRKLEPAGAIPAIHPIW